MTRPELLPWLPRDVITSGAPLSEQVYVQLRNAIVTGRIGPATSIQEPAVAEHFGVSRTPVREALLRLRGDGLVVIRKQAGTFVAPIDAKRVEEGMLVRESLEPRVIEISATRLSERQLADLEAETRIMAKAGNSGAFLEADDRFHKILIDASGFDHIAEIIGRVNAQLDRVRYLSATDSVRARKAVREHRALIRSLRARESAACADLLRHHLQQSWVLIREIMVEKLGMT